MSMVVPGSVNPRVAQGGAGVSQPQQSTGAGAESGSIVKPQAKPVSAGILGTVRGFLKKAALAECFTGRRDGEDSELRGPLTQVRSYLKFKRELGQNFILDNKENRKILVQLRASIGTTEFSYKRRMLEAGIQEVKATLPAANSLFESLIDQCIDRYIEGYRSISKNASAQERLPDGKKLNERTFNHFVMARFKAAISAGDITQKSFPEFRERFRQAAMEAYRGKDLSFLGNKDLGTMPENLNRILLSTLRAESSDTRPGEKMVEAQICSPLKDNARLELRSLAAKLEKSSPEGKASLDALCDELDRTDAGDNAFPNLYHRIGNYLEHYKDLLRILPAQAEFVGRYQRTLSPTEGDADPVALPEIRDYLKSEKISEGVLFSHQALMGAAWMEHVLERGHVDGLAPSDDLAIIKRAVGKFVMAKVQEGIMKDLEKGPSNLHSKS